MYFTFLRMIHPRSDSLSEPLSTVLSFCRFPQIINQTSCFHLKSVLEIKPDFAIATVCLCVLLSFAWLDGGHMSIWTLPPNLYLSNL